MSHLTAAGCSCPRCTQVPFVKFDNVCILENVICVYMCVYIMYVCIYIYIYIYIYTPDVYTIHIQACSCPHRTQVPSVKFDNIAREWRCKWSSLLVLLLLVLLLLVVSFVSLLVLLLLSLLSTIILLSLLLLLLVVVVVVASLSLLLLVLFREWRCKWLSLLTAQNTCLTLVFFKSGE